MHTCAPLVTGKRAPLEPRRHAHVGGAFAVKARQPTMARRKQTHRHVSKAGWSPAELKIIRAALETRHGSGPRAQSRVLSELAGIIALPTEGRVEWRRANPTIARS